MKKTVIMISLSLLTACGAHSNTIGKELTSVTYHLKATVPGHSRTVSAERTDIGYLLTYHKENMEQPDKIEITEADFKKLEKSLLEMKKQKWRKKVDKDEWVETMEVNYTYKGKLFSRRYDSTHYLDKKSYQLKEDAITLMFELKDNYHKQFEIRIYYNKGIATPTEIFTHAEPSDLVEDMGSFLEKRYPNFNKQTGGSNEYSYRWRAIKPGRITVWFAELIPSLESEGFPEEFQPYGTYEIDKNLKVKRIKQE